MKFKKLNTPLKLSFKNIIPYFLFSKFLSLQHPIKVN